MIRHASLASTCAAAVVFFAYLVIYGPLVGVFAAPIAAMVAFVASMVLAGPFLYVRTRVNGFVYFLLHTLAGIAIGATLAARYPYIVHWHQYLYNQMTLTVWCASVAAWLYVACFLPRSTVQESFATALPGLTTVVLTVAIPAMAALIATAPIPADPSCHNVFRGGRLSARPSLRVVIKPDWQDAKKWPALYDDFAADYGLSVRRRSGYRSICNDEVLFEASGTNIYTGYTLTVFPHEGGEWKPLTRELECRLRMQWEASMVYIGNGEEIARPEFLSESCSR